MVFELKLYFQSEEERAAFEEELDTFKAMCGPIEPEPLEADEVLEGDEDPADGEEE